MSAHTLLTESSSENKATRLETERVRLKAVLERLLREGANPAEIVRVESDLSAILALCPTAA